MPIPKGRDCQKKRLMRIAYQYLHTDSPRAEASAACWPGIVLQRLRIALHRQPLYYSKTPFSVIKSNDSAGKGRAVALAMIG